MRADIDERSDIYSLACVLYEMLTGQAPIDHVSMQAMVTRKLTGGYTPLRELRPDLPASLETAVHKALSPDRAERFATMEEFSRAIALASLPTTPGCRRRARWTAAAALLVVVGSGHRLHAAPAQGRLGVAAGGRDHSSGSRRKDS